MLAALEESNLTDEWQQMDRLAELTGVPVPKNLQGLQTRKELHTDVIPTDQMHSYVANI